MEGRGQCGGGGVTSGVTRWAWPHLHEVEGRSHRRVRVDVVDGQQGERHQQEQSRCHAGHDGGVLGRPLVVWRTRLLICWTRRKLCEVWGGVWKGEGEEERGGPF